MNDESAPYYRHTQTGPWCVILYAIGVLMLASGWLLREESVAPVVLPVACALMLVLGASFQHLTVADEGDRLAVWFGPLPLCRRRIRYADMREVEVGRTLLLDSWGIHMSLRGGWVWNCTFRDFLTLGPGE
jgi:hypothetical protein